MPPQIPKAGPLSRLRERVRERASASQPQAAYREASACPLPRPLSRKRESNQRGWEML
ncbi:hypothetical protein CT19431_190029 [Cupriavidus taiwanensis]|nr:hypothetical protein CT19431_190029 [Cupriavidus taiwanensis]